MIDSSEAVERLWEDLRADLRAAAARGELDADIAAGVEEEVDEGDACLPMGDDQERVQFAQTMGRLAGLVDGLPGLAARVGELAGAVPGGRGADEGVAPRAGRGTTPVPTGSAGRGQHVLTGPVGGQAQRADDAVVR